jgi:hypothetical protein
MPEGEDNTTSLTVDGDLLLTLSYAPPSMTGLWQLKTLQPSAPRSEARTDERTWAAHLGCYYSTMRAVTAVVSAFRTTHLRGLPNGPGCVSMARRSTCPS